MNDFRNLFTRALPGGVNLIIFTFLGTYWILDDYYYFSNTIFYATVISSLFFGPLYLSIVPRILPDKNLFINFSNIKMFLHFLYLTLVSFSLIFITLNFQFLSLTLLLVSGLVPFYTIIEIHRRNQRYWAGLSMMYAQSFNSFLFTLVVFIVDDHSIATILQGWIASYHLSTWFGFFSLRKLPKVHLANSIKYCYALWLSGLYQILPKSPESLFNHFIRQALYGVPNSGTYVLVLDIVSRIVNVALSSYRFFSLTDSVDQFRNDISRNLIYREWVRILKILLLSWCIIAFGIYFTFVFSSEQLLLVLSDIGSFIYFLISCVIFYSFSSLKKALHDYIFIILEARKYLNFSYLFSFAPFVGILYFEITNLFFYTISNDKINFLSSILILSGFVLFTVSHFMVIACIRVASNFTPIEKCFNKVIWLTVSGSGGGVERAASCLMDQAVETGVDFRWICVKENIESKGRVTSLNKRRVLFALPSLFNLIRTNQDCVIWSNLTYLNVAVGIIGLFFPKTRIIMLEHNYWGIKYKFKLFTFLLSKRGPLIGLLAFFVYKRYEIFCVNEKLANDLSEIFDKKIGVINNPCDFVPSNSKESFSDFVTFGLIGALTHQKNFSEAIRAFYLTIEHIKSPIRLIIAGVGPQRAQLQALVESLGLLNHVDFLDFVEDPVLDFYNLVDVVIVPSLWEGHSIVTEEALILGKHVIVSDCKFGPSDLVDQYSAGVIYKIGDVEGLAELMVSWPSIPVYRGNGFNSSDKILNKIIEVSKN